MRLGTTLLLLILVAGLGSYIYWIERKQPTTDEKENAQKFLLAEEEDRYAMITVEAPGQKLVMVRKADGLWYLKEPFEDRVAEERVDALLGLTRNALIQEILDNPTLGGVEVKRHEFGVVGEEAVSFTFMGKNIPNRVVSLGKPGPFAGTAYALLPGDKRSQIFLIKTDARTFATQPAEEFRDRRLTRSTSAGITGLDVRTSAGQINFRRASADAKELWRIEKPYTTFADSELIDDTIKVIEEARIEKFVPAETGTIPRDALPQDGVQVSIYRADKEIPEELTLYPTAENDANFVLAHAGSRDVQFHVPRKVYEAINLPTNEFRDASLANLNVKALTTIQVKSVDGEDIFVFKINGSWHLLRGNKILLANQSLVADISKTLNEESILEYTSDTTSDFAEFGLEKPQLEITFDTIIQKKLESPIPPGESSVTLRISESPSGDGRVFANWKNQPFVYRIAPTVVSYVPRESVQWKGLNVLRFDYVSLKGIKFSKDAQPPISLQFDLSKSPNPWSGKLQDVDITKQLDTTKLNRVVGALSHLEVASWAQGMKDGLEALKNPSLRLEVLFESPDSQGKGMELQQKGLRFAPTQPGKTTELYFGTVEGSSEVFLIGRELYDRLVEGFLVPE